MTMTNKLASLSTRVCEPEAIHQIVQTHHQNLEQILASPTWTPGCCIEGLTELALQQAICATYLLFFTQLQCIARSFALSTRTILSWPGIAAITSTLCHTLVAF